MRDEELKKRWDKEITELMKGPGFVLQLNGIEGWILLGNLQLALRHPKNVGESSKIARELAKRIEGMVARSGALAEVARRGWDEGYDYVSGSVQGR